MLGLFPPSSGTAIINNFDIRNNIKGARESLGLCPQYDVLFDEMTVEEHLEFFSLVSCYCFQFVLLCFSNWFVLTKMCS